jgi:paraquat-inducible protein B
VRLGLRSRITAQGITGVNYLELDFVNPDRSPSPPRLAAAHPVIPACVHVAPVTMPRNA